MIVLEQAYLSETVSCKPDEVDSYINNGRTEHVNIGARLVKTVLLMRFQAQIQTMIDDLEKAASIKSVEIEKALNILNSIDFIACKQTFLDPLTKYKFYSHEYAPVDIQQVRNITKAVSQISCVDSSILVGIAEEMEDSDVCLVIKKHGFFEYYWKVFRSWFESNKRDKVC